MLPQFEKPQKSAADRLAEGCMLFALLAIIIAAVVAVALTFAGKR